MNYYKLLFSVFITFVSFSISYSQPYCGLERFAGMNYTLGIDIGNGSMIVDWDKLTAAGVKFVFIKKSYGDSATRKIIYRYVKSLDNCIKDSVFVNSSHLINYKVVWEAAKCHNIIRGVYHYWMNNKSAETQAAEFLDGLSENEFAENTVMPPVLDLEDTTGAPGLDENILKWVGIVESALKKKVIIYAGPKSLWSAYETGSAKLKPETISELVKHGLWTVQLKENITEPATLSWNAWAFWQYCHDFHSEFNSGDIDLNVFNGTYDELLKYNDKCRIK